METHVLVEMEVVDRPEGGPVTRIARVIRTYESSSRASEDLELLHDLGDGKTYNTIQAQHIDR